MSTRSEAKFRDGALKIGLVFIAGFVGLVLCEVAIRLAGVSYPVFDIYDEELGIKLKPGKEGWYRKEGEAYLEINSLGYRDAEHDLEASPDTFRIAVLGDSFTEARQIPIEDTYWDRLGNDLDDCAAIAGQDVEVLNFGIGGYSTTQSLLAYDLDARRFKPDLVLLGFFPGNDVRENSRTLFTANGSWLAPKPFHELVDGQLELSPPAQLPAWKSWIYDGVQHSRLLELINEVRRQMSVRGMRATHDENVEAVEAGISADIYLPLEAQETSPDLAEAWTLTRHILAELKRKVHDDGARFMVVTIPTSVQTHLDTAYREALTGKLGVDDLLFPDRQLAKFGQDDGYPVFPSVAAMQTSVGDRHFHGFANTAYGIGHMNAEGHRVLAETLAGKLCAELDDGSTLPPAQSSAARND
ncbi:MAG: SGNH/GDSL hydrolase family protein [Geminicoccaceae bacterium]